MRHQTGCLHQPQQRFPALSACGPIAATYHVDCQNGSDSNDGLTPSTAWRTIDRANLPAYGPGDAIRLKRGCVWQGTGFKAKGNGSVAAPITLEDYGDPTLLRPVLGGVGAHEAAVLLEMCRTGLSATWN